MCEKNNNQEADKIFERISIEMERQGRQQAELVDYIGLSRGTYTNWKLGRGRNFCEHLGAIAKFLQVDVEWLVTGEVKANELKDAREKKLVELFRKLDAEKQTAVLQNIKWLAE